MALQVGELYATCELDASSFFRDMNRVQNELEDTEDQLNGLGNGASGVGSQFSAMGNMVQGVFQGIGQMIVSAVGQVVEFGKQAVVAGIQYNAMMEQSQIAWETLLGSADKATETIKMLQELGAKTPFEFEGLDKVAKLLNMAGYEGEDLEKVLVNVGDAVSAVGGGADVLEGVGTAISQIATKGKASAEEMNQLAERGIPAWDILADKMGVSTGELMDMVSTGNMLADDVIPALVDGMGERFGGAMEAQSSTFNGLMSTMQDNFKMLMAEVTKGLTNVIKKLLPGVIELMDDMIAKLQGGALEEFAEKVRGIGEVLADTFGPAITPIVESFIDKVQMIKDFFIDLANDGTIQTFIDVVIECAGTLSQIFGEIYTTISGFILNILGNALEIAKPMIEQFVEIVQSIATSLKEFWEEHGETITAIIQGFLDFITPLITFALEFIAQTVMNVVNGVKNMIEGALDFISGIFNTFSALFSGDWSAFWEGIKEILDGALQFALGLFEFIFNTKILKALGTFATNAVNVVKGWVTNVKNWFTNLGTNISNITNASLDQVKNFFSSKMTWIKDFVSNIINSVKSFFSNGLTSIKNTVSNIFTQITNLGTKIKNTFGELIGKAVSWGSDIVKGIARGISGAIGTAIEAVKGVANAIMDKFKSMLGIHSPSRVFQQYGAWTVEGLNNGIEDNLGASERMAEEMANALTPDFSNITIPNFVSDISATNAHGRSIDNANHTTSNGNGVTIQIDKMEVREDSDIEKVAHELYRLQQRQARGRR